MKQQKNLYVLVGILFVFVLLFAIKKNSSKPPVVANQPKPIVSPGSKVKLDEHADPNFYITQYNQEVENSSSHGVGFFQTAYNEVSSFFGLGSSDKKQNKNETSNNGPSAADSSTGGKKQAIGGGGGVASGGQGSSNSSDGSGGGKVSGGGGAQASNGAAKPKKTDGTSGDGSDGSGSSSGLVSNTQAGPPVDPIKQASEQAENTFKTSTHLSVNLPDELTYRNLDLDDGIAGLSGYNTQLQVNISLLAKAGNYGPNDLPGFLQEYGAYIPGYNTAYTDKLSKDTPDRPSAQSGSGLNSPYVWSIQNGSNTITVALVQRQDGQGTYLAVLSGPTSYFDSNEDRYDSIYSQIRATP